MVKQVIILRKDLNMRKGKMVAQGAHASLGAVFKNSTNINNQKCITYTDDLFEWFNESFKKVCVSCDSEKELLDLHKQAENAGLLNCLIQDKGHTEFHNIPTYTSLAIGPANNEEIDKITGNLKLL